MNNWIPDSTRCLKSFSAFIHYERLDGDEDLITSAVRANADKLEHEIKTTVIDKCATIDGNNDSDSGFVIRTDVYVLSPTELSTMIENAYREGQMNA